MPAYHCKPEPKPSGRHYQFGVCVKKKSYRYSYMADAWGHKINFTDGYDDGLGYNWEYDSAEHRFVM